MKQYRVAVVGATGMVGRTFLKVLEEYQLPVSEYVLFSSARSAGSVVSFMGKEYTVQELTETSFNSGFDIALFSAGGSISAKFAPIAAEKGCIVIDNSSQWRMDPNVPLVVPEVNPEDIDKNQGIIANPNCSTIQAMLPLKALHNRYGIKRIVYSTYQAVSGAGRSGYDDLVDGTKAFVNGETYEPKKFPAGIFSNCLPQIDVFMDNGYTKEEMKMVEETRKILHDDSIRITATAVRVPVLNCHSESINVELAQPFELEDVFELMRGTQGIVLMDDPKNNVFPHVEHANGHDEVFVGRIRKDFSIDNGLNFWCVADNIRKGAAANAVQIARKIMNDQK